MHMYIYSFYKHCIATYNLLSVTAIKGNTDLCVLSVHIGETIGGNGAHG